MSARRSESPAGSPTGDAFPAESSRRIDAHLVQTAANGAVDLVDSGDGKVLVSAVPSAILREPRLGSLPSTIVFPSGWRFLSHDHGGIDALLGPAGTDRLLGWEAYRPRLILVFGLALVLAFAVWRWGLGALVAVAVAVTPDALPSAIDDGHIAVVDRMFADPSALDRADQARVRRVFGQLKAVAPAPRFGEYILLFRSMPKVGPNAFAMPGGTVVVTDQLVRAFPDSDAIAGVLGHEIAHVTEAHGLKQIYRSLGTYMLVSLIAGDVGPVLDDLLLEGGLLLSLSYSREHEREADRIGMTIAAKAGYDPAALALFFEKLPGSEQLERPSWLSTHLASRDRIVEIRRLAEDIERSAR